MRAMLRLPTLAVFFAVLPILLILQACSFTAPTETAETLEQKAFAIYGTFVNVEEEAADLVENPATPPGVISAIQQADAVAKPLADTLAIATREYAGLRAQIDAIKEAGGTPSEQLAGGAVAALGRLQTAYDGAKPKITALIDVVRGFTD